MFTEEEGWWWVVFFLLLALIRLIDVVVLHGGKAHRVSLKESSFWVLVWMSLALLFNLFIWINFSYQMDSQIAKTKALEFLTGYLIEWSLSVDNLFVFLLIFNYFG